MCEQLVSLRAPRPKPLNHKDISQLNNVYLGASL